MEYYKSCIMLHLIGYLLLTIACVSGQPGCHVDEACPQHDMVCSFPYSSCPLGFCECDEGFYDNPQRGCVRMLDIGQVCDHTEDCEVHNVGSSCVDDGETSLCQCPENQEVTIVEGQGYCARSPPEDQCNEDLDCLSYVHNPDIGVCRPQEGCGCTAQYNYVDGVCMPAQYGETCYIDIVTEKQCDQTRELQCVGAGEEKTCDCPTNTYYDLTYGRCIHNNIVSKHLGRGYECNTEYTSSSGKLCRPTLVCDDCPGVVGGDTTCHRTLREQENILGAACDADERCSNHIENTYCNYKYTTCSTGQCDCKEGFYPHGETCRPVRSMGEKCERDEDCQAGAVNAVCSNVCECEQGYQYTTIDEIHYCYKSGMGQPCGQDEDCLSYLYNMKGECVDDACGCNEKYIQDGDTCSDVPLSEECDLPGQDGGMQCHSNSVCVTDGNTGVPVCVCPVDTQYDEEYDVCMHKDAEIIDTPGAACNNAYLDPNAKVCEPYMDCFVCPHGSRFADCLVPVDAEVPTDGEIPTEPPDNGALSVSMCKPSMLMCLVIVTTIIFASDQLVTGQD